MKLIKYILESAFIIIILPYLSVSLATSITELGLAIVLFMAILPVYFVISPLRFSQKTKIIWLIPLFNALLFFLSVRLTFNNSADSYLVVYILLAYLGILIKTLIYRHAKKQEH